MPWSKPTAGFPTLADACAALARTGLTSREIGAKLSIDTSKASAMVAYRLGKDGINPSRERHPTGSVRPVAISIDVLDALAPDAARRGISVNRLIRDLLANVADDGLVDAVLDDAPDLSPRPRQVPA